MLTHILLVTTDGTRRDEVRRLFESIPAMPGILVALLEQGGSTTQFSCGHRMLRLSIPGRLSLSAARNRLLDVVCQKLLPNEVGPQTRLIFSDDDCWYSNQFFEVGTELAALNQVLIHPAYDPNSGRAFAVNDVRSLINFSHIDPKQILFLATSISIDVPARLGLQLRFNERIGLGCKVSQGEETLYLYQFMNRYPDSRVLSLNDGAVFHPHKLATNPLNHYSLAYFLGWVGKEAFPFTGKYFRYKLIRALARTIAKPSTLSLQILRGLVSGFFAGRADYESIGSPHEPNWVAE